MFGVPVAWLVLWTGFPALRFTDGDLVPMLVAGALGLVGVMVAPWKKRAKPIVTALYALSTIPPLPVTFLVAECAAGNCHRS
jgi:hypothetical protein